MSGAVPAASRGIVEAIVREIGCRANGPSTVLLHADPVWDGPDSITVGTNGNSLTVTVRPAKTVLAVLDLIDRHDGNGLLVVPTDMTENELGTSLRAQIAGHKVTSIDPWEAIRANSKAEHIDRRLRGKGDDWIAEQLLYYGSELWKRRSQPPRALAREDVLRRLLGLHLHSDPDAVVDVASMLTWSQAATNIEQWHDLDRPLRDHLAAALREIAGQTAALVVVLAETGEARDAPPVAVAAKALADAGSEAQIPQARFEQRFFGNDRPDADALRRFAEAGLAHLQRQAESDKDIAGAAFRRAEAILAEIGAESVIAASDLFVAGLHARLADFAAILKRTLSRPEGIGALETSFEQVKSHTMAADRSGPIEDARAALRLTRWLANEVPQGLTVSEWVDWQIREGGWVDSARARLRVADTANNPRLGRVYQALLDRVRERRALADQRFAERLAAWNTGETERLLLAENLQDRIMRPLAGTTGREAAPLLVVCDGMSAADAITIGADIAAGGSWVEVGRFDSGREGALATVPSSTVYSRASLLAGSLVSGGQEAERKGLTQLWGRRKVQLFHKGDLRATEVGQIPKALQGALADRDTVVAVVLNTIDDALDKDELASRPLWQVSNIDYLQPLLDAASRTARPIVLCSDHGHVREPGNAKAAVWGDSARWRSGEAATDGEVVLTGPRVLEGDALVAAVDERVRYRSKRSGYHGGASLAEMVIPVQVYVPTAKARAEHWVVYDSAAVHQPEWWNNSVRTAEPSSKSKQSGKPTQSAATLFAEVTLGQQICESDTYRAHVKGLRRVPDSVAVMAIIDAVQSAGGVLASAQVGKIADKPAASVDGYVSQLQRALNIDGTQVLSKQDDGTSIRIDLELLRQQFLGGRRR
ncbi:BREX-2 system phosphatase PglZ [Natronoglycomyces albus]|uniref:BREX-2 system phosphatase PglZ n=1 Tax=Natronoglycomyces albus TaxID=2811108 RepID=A0A895XP37_9ACTN|nr:BREX-2 system phosphatase PglZ [Natronoglycomyces albus]QSB05149.1 BREX-2 system phosphatase PglZ [Natronoglycomyces albus]